MDKKSKDIRKENNENFYDAYQLAKKIQFNSYEQMWNDAMKDASKKPFVFYDPKVAEEITKTSK